jgi:uncharacterized protein (DUF433 family)
MKSEMATTTNRETLVQPEHYVYSHITKIPGVCGGYATIDGHHIRVIDVIYLHKWGYSQEKMLETYPSLNLAQIYAAISYYYENQSELDEEIRESEEFFDRMEQEWEDYVERHGGHPPDKPAPEDRHIAKPTDWKPKR